MTLEHGATAFTRLPGRGRRITSGLTTGESQRLYSDGGHLLVLRRVGYEETSKRYALADIQAITVQSNADRLIRSVLLLFPIILLAAIAVAAIGEGVDPTDIPMYFLYGFAGIFGIFLLVNLALGPTCTVRLHTAVQIEDLTALRRLRAARKCLAILVPRIEAAQGGPLPALAGQSARASASAKQERGKKPPKVIGRALHAAAFTASAMFGLSSVAELFYESTASDMLNFGLLAVAMLLLVTAAIRQSNSTIPRQTFALTWATFSVHAVMFMLIAYTMTFVTAFAAAAAGDSPNAINMSMVTIGGEDPRWVDTFTAAWGVVSLALSLFGLFSIRGYTLVERGSSDAKGAPPG